MGGKNGQDRPDCCSGHVFATDGLKARLILEDIMAPNASVMTKKGCQGKNR